MNTDRDTVIEVFADIWCPFTHVGLRALDDLRRRRGRHDVVLRIRSWPLELVNGAPMSCAATQHHVDDLRAQVDDTMFEGLDPTCFPTSTLDALALAAKADRRDVRLGERVGLRLRDALFEQGLDISQPEVLAELAGEFDLDLPDDTDRAQVLADWDEGRRRGVVGSPHFFCGDESAFCTALSISRDEQSALHITPDVEGMTAFFDQCVGVSR
jgi:predicted DsbA family dithiol-disulfide isomerase